MDNANKDRTTFPSKIQMGRGLRGFLKQTALNCVSPRLSALVSVQFLNFTRISKSFVRSLLNLSISARWQVEKVYLSISR